ncbi:MAG TPA: hypothetical protein VHK28_09480, partial [Candidatus Limnocylindria bacterium]|nr:hypothetical protein [Candidatus Limnocylindria bacterium]
MASPWPHPPLAGTIGQRSRGGGIILARADPMLARIEEAFDRARGGGVIVRRSAGSYSLSSARTGGRIARLRPTG